ncbi:MAG: hypothetical protein CVU11_15095 [Bacteroidetes bacterium HGW-Bacteroidetes-6]|jgi:hypothetical protein|nr:MAG: hypothetical protein CVU11_15095 [Bacteroidetes bacterium HGW-Bacteroidetes-6]
MKTQKLFLRSIALIALFLTGSTAYSQVAFSQVTADVSREYPGCTVTDRGLGSKNFVDKSVFPNIPYLVTFVRASNKKNLEGHTVTCHRNIEVRYDNIGGYKFNSAPMFGAWLIGVPNPPTIDDAKRIIENDLLGFFRSFTYNKLTSFDGVMEIVQNKYECEECNNFRFDADYDGLRVRLKVKVKYSMLRNTTLEDREDVFEVVFMRESINKPWTSIQAGGAEKEASSKMPISSKRLTPAEVAEWECNTLGMKYMKEHAVDEYNKLPAIDEPKFANAKEMIWFTHRFLRTATADQVRKYLWGHLASYYFSKCGSFILSEAGEELIDKVISFVTAEKGSYGETYCDYPQVKEQQGNDGEYTIVYYSKLGTKFSRIHVLTEDNQYKIIDISLGQFTQESDLQALSEVPADKCNEFAPATWSTFTHKTLNTSTLYPSEPVFTEDGNSLTATYKGGQYTMTGKILEKSVTSQIKQESQRLSTAKSWSDKFRTNLGAQLKSEKTFTYDGTEGVEYIWKLYQNRVEIIIRYRAILYKDGYYQMWIYGSTGSEEENKFFDNFKVN